MEHKLHGQDAKDFDPYTVTSSNSGIFGITTPHSISVNKLLVDWPMFSRTNSSSDKLTFEALYNSNTDFISLKYSRAGLWKAETSAR
jgi:hypothetical protein